MNLMMARRHILSPVLTILCLGLAAFLSAACRADSGGDDSAKVFEAIGAKDGAALSRLLGQPRDFTRTNSDGETYLSYAIEGDYVNGVSLLIAAHAPVNVKNTAGETPLRQAVAKRNIAIISLLLEAGAIPDEAGLDRAYANRDIDLEIITLLNGPKNSAAPVADNGRRNGAAQSTVSVRVGLSAAERDRLKKEIAAEILKSLQSEGNGQETKIMKLRDIISEEKK
jgi:hypothetical protein